MQKTQQEETVTLQFSVEGPLISGGPCITNKTSGGALH